MCCATVTSKEEFIFEIPYISNVEEFLQHLMAMYYYLVVFPTLGTYDDNFDAHVVQFDDLEVQFFGPSMENM